MSHSHSLRQLLRIRLIEEEQSRTALEVALGELNRLERALVASREREHRGRALVFTSTQRTSADERGVRIDAANPLSEQGIDRRAGIEDAHAARRQIEALTHRLSCQRDHIEELRTDFLAHRVERRQVETLIAEERAKNESAVEHKTRQTLDDWFGSRLIREKQSANRRTG